MSYCYHCMTKIDAPENPFCPECGKKHNIHYAQSHELPAGTKLCNERYIVGKCIGEGGFSVTYIGFDTKMTRKVVIKETYYRDVFYRNCMDKSLDKPLEVTYDSSVSLNEIIGKTEKECRSLCEAESLNNIVKVYDWFSENNTAYIIMEYINGDTLYDRVQEKGVYSWQSLYRKMKPLMKSLSVLHKKGVVHRDIKPSNIMIKQVYENKYDFVLIDFGLARSENAHTLGTAGMSFTPGYAPIEQRNFTHNDGTYTDVYALAATIYYAMVGEVPESKLSDNVEENFPKLKELMFSGRITRSVSAALNAALKLDYRERCQNIDDFINIIEDIHFDELIESEEKHENVQEVNNTPIASRNIPDESQNSTPESYDDEDKVTHTSSGMKGLMVLILLVIALPLLVLGGYIVYNYFNPVVIDSNTDSEKTFDIFDGMPSVVGLTYEQCMLVLDDKKYDVDVKKIASDNLEADTVARQEPSAGETVFAAEGEKFKVTVYVVGEVDTDTDSYLLSPNCMDKDVDEAVKICEDLGLDVEYYYQGSSNDLVGDVVIYQSPMYGEYISKDVPITLIVRKGKDKSRSYKIEDYFGLKYDDVKAELEKEGWTVSYSEEERTDYNDGVIIWQSIEKGTIVDFDDEDEIEFIVAKEPKKTSSSKSESKSSDKSSESEKKSSDTSKSENNSSGSEKKSSDTPKTEKSE